MKMIYKIGLVTLPFILFGMLSCKSKKNAQESKSSKSKEIAKVIVEEGFTGPKENDHYSINSVKVDGDILVLEVSHSAGCGDHTFTAKTNRMYLKSMPPKLGIHVIHDNGGNRCKMLSTHVIKFDLTSVRYPGKDKDYSIYINLDGWEEPLLYKY